MGVQRGMVLHPWRNGLDAGGGEAIVEGHMACAFRGKGLVSKGLVSLE